MPSIERDREIEHFVTLFDSNFLPAGLCLYQSLSRHCECFRLWVVCMDEAVEQQLRELDLSGVSLIPLRHVESEALLRAKADRTRAEYCWTITPFSASAVMAADVSVKRVTYVDADLYFFGPPQILLRELDDASADVLITEHAYAPDYDESVAYGIYCVQFITFKNSMAAREILRWWQDRCIEWCYARPEAGRFGDQKYLDDWPLRFPGAVHVVHQKSKTLAPWNAKWMHENDPATSAVFFHFHGFRIVSDRHALLYRGYRVDKNSDERYYGPYFLAICEALMTMLDKWGEFPTLPEPRTVRRFASLVWYGLHRRLKYRSIKLSIGRTA